MVQAFVGLGSNLGDREGTLRAAVGRLRALPHTSVVAVSKLRNTEPVGHLEQPRFLNGAVELETGLSARALLDALMELERRFGRDRTVYPPQGPRTRSPATPRRSTEASAGPTATRSSTRTWSAGAARSRTSASDRAGPTCSMRGA